MAALHTARRFRSFHFYLNLDDPEDTQRSVNEDLERLAQEKKTDTAAYLHSLLNLSLSYFQAQDYIRARQLAELTHSKAVAYNKQSSFLFLTAKTCAQSCVALADQYESHLKQVEGDAQRSPATLAPKPSVVFSAQRAIRKLREDAVRYDGIARRVYNRPENAFMRGWGNEGFGGDRRSGRASSSGQAHRHSERRDVRCAFSEDGHDVDLEWEGMYGTRWQQRRRRPEHAELRRHQQQQVANRGSHWTVPK